jgi:hypothetical protein
MGQADDQLNIHWCILGSGGLLTEYSLVPVYTGVRRIADRIFIGVYRCQADDRPNIHWMCEWVRRMTNQIFIGVYRCQADDQPNIHWMCEWVGRMTN